MHPRPKIANTATSGVYEITVILGTVFFAALSFLTMVPGVYALVLAFNCIATGSIAFWIGKTTRGRGHEDTVVKLFCFYLLFAFSWKAIVARLPLPDAYLREFIVPLPLFKEALPITIAYTLGAFLAVFVAVKFSRAKQLRQTIFKGSMMPIQIAIIFSLALKAFTQFQFDWGVPGAEPRNVIPQVTGMIVMHSRYGIHFMLSLLVLQVAQQSGSQASRIATILLCIINLALDIAVGAKFSLIYFSVTFVFAFLYARPNNKNYKMRHVVVIALSAAVLVITFYQFAQYYRFSRLSNGNQTVTQIAATAFDNVLERSEDSFVLQSAAKVLKRVNGFQNTAATIQHEGQLKVRLRHLIASTDITEVYTQLTTGIKNKNNANGLTQCGFFAVFSKMNPMQVFFSSLLFNFALYIGMFQLLRICVRSVENAAIVGLTVGLLLVTVQFAGGNLLFYGKQLLILLIASFLVDFVVLRFQQKSRQQPSNYGAPTRRPV